MACKRHRYSCALTMPTALILSLVGAVPISVTGGQLWALQPGLPIETPAAAQARPATASTTQRATTQPTTQRAAQPTKDAATTRAVGAPFKDDKKQPLRLYDNSETNSRVLMRMLVYVLIILVLGALAIVIARKKWISRLVRKAGRSKEVALVETSYLGPGRTIHLVEVGTRRFLLASTSQSISMLAEVTKAFSEVLDDQAASEMSEDDGESSGVTKKF